jgi:hypothetical protein
MSGRLHGLTLPPSRKEPLVLGDMRLVRLRRGLGGSEEKYLLLPGIKPIFLSRLIQLILCNSA